MDDVKSYYDHNTRRFLHFGDGNREQVIHRAVNLQIKNHPFDLMRSQELLILEELKDVPAGTVVDLGCGVGASMNYIAASRSGSYRGITLSSTQAAVAARTLQKHSSSEESCLPEVYEGSYLDRDLVRRILSDRKTAAAYAIESFLHCPDPAEFFSLWSSVLKPGGKLIICDDFSIRPAEAEKGDTRRERLLRDFKRGWKVENLLEVKQVKELAGNYGLVPIGDRDLTPNLVLQRPRDRIIRFLVSVLRPMELGERLPLPWSWWQNFLGGNALQQALLAGDLSYRFLVFRKPESHREKTG
ncbi:MAG: methyltransferase domain-containing protein [Spirochaetales bacterium]|nr:methyltransferase domain-containing protein [Spirochaetales bacterium]MCF7938043.1 methyltransferase domain-containing protein [Spirochaetales bacterium]